MEIQEFIKLDEKQQYAYILQLEEDAYKTFSTKLKRKNMRLSLKMSSHRQSNKNIVTSNKDLLTQVPSELNTDEILPNPEQPRKEYTEDEVQNKMDSIQSRGLITPITVKKVNNKIYLVAGQLRLEAIRRLYDLTKEEKYLKIKVFFEENDNYSNIDFAIDSLIENINRSNMSVLDTANGILRVYDENDLSTRELAKSLGQSIYFVSSYVQIGKAAPEIKSFIKENKIENPSVVYEVLKLNLSSDKSIHLLKLYSDGKLKRDQIKDFKEVDVDEKKEIKTIEKKNVDSSIDNILSFKKQFKINKYKKLSEEKRVEADNKIKEIEELQKQLLLIISS